MQVSSVASPAAPSKTFEVDQAASFTGPSSLAAALPATPSSAEGRWHVAGAARRALTSIKPGDQLLLVASDYEGVNDAWCAITSMPSQQPPTRSPAPRHPRHAGRGDVGVAVVRLAGQLLEHSSDCGDYRLLRPDGTAALWNPPNGHQDRSTGAVIAEFWNASGVTGNANLSVGARHQRRRPGRVSTPFGGPVAVVGAVTTPWAGHDVANPQSGAATQPTMHSPVVRSSACARVGDTFTLFATVGEATRDRSQSLRLQGRKGDHRHARDEPGRVARFGHVAANAATAVGATALLEDPPAPPFP